MCVCLIGSTGVCGCRQTSCGPHSLVLQQDLGEQVLQAGMEGLREEAEDLLRGAQVVEDDVIRQDVESLDHLEHRESLRC